MERGVRGQLLKVSSELVRRLRDPPAMWVQGFDHLVKTINEALEGDEPQEAFLLTAETLPLVLDFLEDRVCAPAAQGVDALRSVDIEELQELSRLMRKGPKEFLWHRLLEIDADPAVFRRTTVAARMLALRLEALIREHRR